MVTNVNDIAIRSHDTKPDDKYLNVDGNCNEPSPPPLDIHDK